MGDKKLEELFSDDYKKITVEYGLEEGDETGFKEPPKWHKQGFILNLRRMTRFSSYSLWSNLPTAIYQKQFNSAYLPFARRHHSLGLAGAAFILYQFVKIVGDS